MNELPRVSLIMTFFNERDSVARFFEGLQEWTALPDEIVMVDGGSNDGTQAIVKDQIPNAPIPCTLIEEQKCNVPRGRNIAIDNAQHDLIAVTDMGCTIAPDWYEKLMQPFRDDPAVDVVGGFYEPLHHTPLQTCFYHLTHNPDLNRKFFYPSSRSLALRRKVWEAVGKYPEHIIAGEDTLFDIRIREAGFKEVFAPEAKVYWEVKDRLGLVYNQYYRYARGAGRALLLPQTYGFYFVNYLLMLVWLVIGLAVHPAGFALFALNFAAYFWYRIFRKKLVLQNFTPGNVARYFALILTIDWAGIIGYAVGIGKYFLSVDEHWGPAIDKQ